MDGWMREEGREGELDGWMDGWIEGNVCISNTFTDVPRCFALLLDKYFYSIFVTYNVRLSITQ